MKDWELLQSFFSIPSDYSTPDSIDQDKIHCNLIQTLSVRSKDHGRT